MAASVALAQQRAIGGVAGCHGRVRVIAARAVEIALGNGRPHAENDDEQGQRHQTRPEQAADPHSKWLSMIGRQTFFSGTVI
jgi:hypothetical protein